MRSRLTLLTLSLCFLFALLGCNKPPASDSGSSTDANASATTASSDKDANRDEKNREPRQAKPGPVVVPAGTSITVSLGSAIGAKLSPTGQTFSGTLAKDVLGRPTGPIARGSDLSGSIPDAKRLGKFA